MGFSSFRLLLVLQISAILALGGLLVWLLTATSLHMTATLVGLVLAVAVVALIHYVETTNRKLNRFLLAVKHADYSQNFSNEGKGESFDDLAETMDGILERLRETRGDQEEQALFLRALVQHVPVALIAFRLEGEVTLFNNAARRLLGTSEPHRVESCSGLGASFVEALHAIEPGQQVTIPVSRGGERLQLNLSATLLRQRGRDEKLVCIQDMSAELEARELDAIQKLMRVLTHEVMNSITPITSLADTASHEVAALQQKLGRREELDDVLAAVETIGRRGSGLRRFVNSYREMTRIPEPEITTCAVAEILDDVRRLMHDEAAARGVEIAVRVDPSSLEISADPELVEQALINLVRNALEAVEGSNGDKKPAVALTAEVDRTGRALVGVEDNGPGLSEEAQHNLFVPFFTTKKSGSGVGMSVVRQIMRLHRGSVGVESDADRGTAVSLRF